jgi:acetyl-CoA carboxylase, biotin carboxylase subunit
MFRKVLIANRGEIAVRILRACHELGVLVVAVYSEQDRGALHVRYADEAYSLGSGSSEDTYLDGDKILAISGKAGVDAIHPGYGFLAENPDFAQACQEKGVVFIGPSGQSLEIMGRKLTARSNMTRAWIPVIPGGEFPPDDKKGALKVANDLRFPVLIKAVAGGGGKGIRRVDRSEHFFEAVRVAGAEAKAAFGNDALYLEKYVPRARHIEFQILADHYGNIIHLFDRECSIQRRYQKVLEECPSPFLDDTTRLRMAGVALSAALAVKYTGAGTVEFLVDPEKNFYFLELNARLQVEHPVTEMVTGVDIVKAQIRIAEGEKLSLTQRDVQPIGASLVCRIYAEDPEANFLPSTGRIERLQMPSGPGIRVDLGIYQGYTVSIDYDPIIAKVIAWGRNRQEAILRMDRALREFVIKGIKTTLPFHRWLVNHPSFIKGDFDTTFVDQEYLRKRREQKDAFWETACLAAAIRTYQKDHKGVGHEYQVKLGDAIYDIKIESLRGRKYRVFLLSHEHQVDFFEVSENLYSMISDGHSYEVDLMDQGGLYQVFVRGRGYSPEILGPGERLSSPIKQGRPPLSRKEVVTSPMACKIARILVKAEHAVEKGQQLLITEAMKMEMPVSSPMRGRVKEVLVREGQTVDAGAKLLTLAPR